ncbi:MAG: ferrous iron transport protein B [Pseudodesulfovibrio sp.]|uniref:Ferrous iron transport protein B n=1 Tax=Pseudodesulfovibrio aespoeensis (strain ATCC 700646 / DSM 10631 / Aspo-2) TaxID=643562 RepID=E6VRH6_PSEA9|nr:MULTISPECIES: ferrous iron transport protein B [Pseudodesulfovibrio]MBU4475882.1 ferrous iron transport protein B [Pseudomonadota bacterium]ADU63013.1 ferrous iron transport protein B [Pseudodesulfovibrio aespoeensis Aspo-2]MBU4516720.1 ferrous iron transport protein B [Pseudomonadota bacterium]MBU4522677.1 ferrous iron transport protein B [Pseudomonadota bacterium]MBU4558825.1 ferrous iron transport protein B [Pseudomonadota bacterium]
MGKYTLGIAGNPNCGKTTMFNALTGARQHVANWPGVTVEKKVGIIKAGEDTIELVDLPGTYSLTAYTQEELVARNFLVEERPQVVIDVMNADALERNLYLAVQIMELGVPLVLGLNMMDEVRKSGKDIDSEKLAALSGCKVVETVARSGKGADELLRTSLALAKEQHGQWKPLNISYGPDLDPVLDAMQKLIETESFLTDKVPARWTGIKYLERDEDVIIRGRMVNSALSSTLENMAKEVATHTQKTLKAQPDALIADHRYGFIAGMIKDVVTYPVLDADRISRSDQMDKVLTHTFLGPLIMLGIVYMIYQITFTVGEVPMGWLESLFGWLGDTVTNALPEGHLRSLLVSGIIDGVGGVLGFVPLIMFMFLMISALEDSGYIARMAYMLDRVFKIFGLHGTSVLPFIVSGGIAGGCAVPGVMATRTLRSPKEKLATIFVAPYMTCGAKVPVFLMLTAAFFPNNAAAVMLTITLGAWVMALVVARILRSTIIRGASTPFVMELPPYRMPTLRGVLIHTWERTWEYAKKAGTIILGISILIWAMMTFPQLPEERTATFEAQRAPIVAQLEALNTDADENAMAALEEQLAQVDNAEAEASIHHTVAGRIGTALEPITRFAGFDWRTNIALTGGFAAKEVIVSTLGTAYSLGEVDPEDTNTLAQKLVNDPMFTPASAVALILFTMLYAPCFVTVVAMARESSWTWAAYSVVGSTVLAYGMAVAGYNLARLLL